MTRAAVRARSCARSRQNDVSKKQTFRENCSSISASMPERAHRMCAVRAGGRMPSCANTDPTRNKVFLGNFFAGAKKSPRNTFSCVEVCVRAGRHPCRRRERRTSCAPLRVKLRRCFKSVHLYLSAFLPPHIIPAKGVVQLKPSPSRGGLGGDGVPLCSSFRRKPESSSFFCF